MKTAWDQSRSRTTDVCDRKWRALVAQTGSLLCRRLVAGKGGSNPFALETSTSCGLQTRDTAECNSALPRQPNLLLPITPIVDRGIHDGAFLHRLLWGLCAVAVILGLPGSAAEAVARKTLPVARPARTTSVDFYREVVPVFQANCLPCHNKTTTKADLSLENPAEMLKGGESGPAIVAGKSAESLLLKVATHAEKPRMPPKENKVNAIDLTPEELGLVALWIDQGAKASEKHDEIVAWQALPDTLNPIYAATITADGRYAACGRGNRIDVYRLPGGRHLGRLSDPSAGASNAPAGAHRDVVNALAFSPDGSRLASGGFREVKLWKRTYRVEKTDAAGLPVLATDLVRRLAADGKTALWGADGVALIADAATKEFVAALVTDAAAEEAAGVAERALVRARSIRDVRQAALDATGKELDAQRERSKRSLEAREVAEKAVAAKDPAVALARRARFEAELALVRLDRSLETGTNRAALRKAATEKLEAATKAVEAPETEMKTLLQKLDSARNERELAATGIDKAASAASAARWRREASEPEVAQAERIVREMAGVVTRSVGRAIAGAFSPDGKRVATVHDDGTLRVWDAADASPVERIPVADGLRGIAFIDDSTVLVSTASKDAYRVGIHPSWVLERTLGGPTAPLFSDRVTALAFRADGLRLAIGGGEPTRGGDVLVADPATGAVLYALPALHSDTVLALAWSPDGAGIASGGADRFARLIDTGAGQPGRVLEGHSGHVLGIAWSPDGTAIATAGADLVVKLWDARTGDKRKQATGFVHEVTAVSFLENPQRLVAASGDAELRVLNENGERVLGLTGTADFTYAMAVTPDGRWILAGGQDSTLRVWRNGQAEPVAQLKDAMPSQVAGK